MRDLRIAGVRRDSRFSPNHIDNDAYIFSSTADELRELGCEVIEYTEKEFVNNDIDQPVVFNMARDWHTVRKLQRLEDSGRLILNSGYGIENCTREKMTKLLLSNRVPHPESLIEKTTTDPTHDMQLLGKSEFWIKRGDFQAMQRSDVSFVRNIEEAKSVLREYASRGIKTAVINEHLQGDLVKFYGVLDTDFFHWFYPGDYNHSKFGLEKINGTPKGIHFDPQDLKKICSQAAQVLGVRIYGGDCVIDEHDKCIKIIDFNDWPSFAPCRDRAAESIAGMIYAAAKKQQAAALLAI